jgi:peptidoglycan/LPS O-acetylase OafA/YrhL
LSFNIINLLFGITFPCLAMLFIPSLSNLKYLSDFFSICGEYSFYIYLFQWPLVLPILSRSLIDIAHISNFFMPFLITVLTIVISILLYKVLKAIRLNIIFE